MTDRTPVSGAVGADRPSRARTPPARDRILSAAYELFCREGIQAVGIDAIIERSGVAKMSLYRHFRSKDELVLAVLARRQELWTERWLMAEVEERAADAAGRLLAVFDVFDAWFRRPDFEGCFFINCLLEFTDPTDPIHVESRSALALIRSFLHRLASEAGAPEPDRLAAQWHVLMKGSIVAAQEGDQDAALKAQELGRLLLHSLVADQVYRASPSPS